MDDQGDGRIRLSPDEVDSAYSLYVVAREWSLPDPRMLEDFGSPGLVLLSGVHDQGSAVKLEPRQVSLLRYSVGAAEKLGKMASTFKLQLEVLSNNPAAEEQATVINHRRLARSYGTNFICKLNNKRVAICF